MFIRQTSSMSTCEMSILCPGGSIATFHIDFCDGGDYRVYKMNKDAPLERLGSICSTLTEAQNIIAAWLGRLYMPQIVSGSLEMMDLPPID